MFGRDFLEPSLEGHFPSKGSPGRLRSGGGACDFALPHTVSRGQCFERCWIFPVSVQEGGASWEQTGTRIKDKGEKVQGTPGGLSVAATFPCQGQSWAFCQVEALARHLRPRCPITATWAAAPAHLLIQGTLRSPVEGSVTSAGWHRQDTGHTGRGRVRENA